MVARGRRSKSHFSRVVVCAAANGGRVLGLSLQEVVEHVYGVGFIRGSLDLHRSDMERHRLLGLEDLDTTVSHGGCMMLWSLDLKLTRGIVNLCYACMNLLYCVEMFVQCQERNLVLIP